MSNSMLAILGGLVGLAWAVFANVVVLPYVHRSNAARYQRRPFLRTYLTFIYRVAMPVLFAIVGGMAAVQMFGTD